MKYYELNIKRRNGINRLIFSASSDSKFSEYMFRYYVCKGKEYTWRQWSAETIEPAIKAGFVKVYKQIG